METPHFTPETQEGEERSPRQEKMHEADARVARELADILVRVEEEMREQHTVALQGREYPIENEDDRRLAYEQRTSQHLEHLLESAGDDYYYHEAIAKSLEVSRWREAMIVRTSELTREYPQTAGQLLHHGEHRDTPKHT